VSVIICTSILVLLNSHGGGQLIESLSHFPLVGSRIISTGTVIFHWGGHFPPEGGTSVIAYINTCLYSNI